MKYCIISATNRPESKTRQVVQVLQGIYHDCHRHNEIIDLKKLSFNELVINPYSKKLPSDIQDSVIKLNHSSAFTIVCPEYNGSFPGILKFFMDHWYYPETFYFRPICLIGLGGQSGGRRAIEQLQQILLHQSAFLYPDKVLLRNVQSLLESGKIRDKSIIKALYKQAKGFFKFVEALEEKRNIATPSPSSF